MHHTIIWQTCGPDGGLNKPGSGEELGNGDGAGFVELLAPEDRIGIVARAKVRSRNLSCSNLLIGFSSRDG
jgi:hypothetical protein